MRKPTLCICENKDADQLHVNREADRRLCFRFSDSIIHLLLKYKISSFYPSSVTVQTRLCRTPWKTTNGWFCHDVAHVRFNRYSKEQSKSFCESWESLNICSYHQMRFFHSSSCRFQSNLQEKKLVLHLKILSLRYITDKNYSQPYVALHERLGSCLSIRRLLFPSLQ